MNIVKFIKKSFSFLSHRFALIATICIISGLLLGFLSQYVNPKYVSFLAFFGMGFKYIFYLSLILLVFLIFAKSKKVFWLLACYLICFVPITRIFAFNDKQNFEGEKLKFMSFNVRIMDKYNWIKGLNTRENILDFINNENPDILCLQEFSLFHLDEVKDQKEIMEMLGYKYVIGDYDPYLDPKKSSCFQIFSRYPLQNLRSYYDTTNVIFAISAQTPINNKTYRIYNAHLQSIHLGNEDYQFIDSIKAKNTKKRIFGFMSIISKISLGYQKRVDQVNILKNDIDTCKDDVIICGDFNEPPISYTYNRLQKGLDDAFLQSSSFCGDTYLMKIFGFRIDYILYRSSTLKPFNFKTSNVELSDHKPISVEFSLLCNQQP